MLDQTHRKPVLTPMRTNKSRQNLEIWINIKNNFKGNSSVSGTSVCDLVIGYMTAL